MKNIYTLNIKTLITYLLIISGLLACNKKVSTISLTPEEQLWVKSHPFITLAVDDTYPPLNFRDKQGKLAGLNIDLVALIEERLGLPIILDGSNWNIALKKAMSHEVDGIINATPLEERKSKLSFSDEFFRDPMALVCHESKNTYTRIADLEGAKIAAKKDSWHLKILKTRVVDVEIVEINNLLEGVELLSLKKVDGIFDDLAPLYHIISRYNFNNIKVAFIEENTLSSMVGVRNDDPVLLSLFNKAIQSISEEEKNAIQNKWFQFTPHKDYTIFYIAIAILFAITLIIGLWSWSLRIIVKRKTQELYEELRHRKKTEIELLEAKEKAEESDTLKSAFLANMSHEIRTPLNAILGFGQLIMAEDLSRDDRYFYAKIVASSSNTLLGLINDIVDFSKIEAGYLEIHMDTLPLWDILNDLKPIYELQINNEVEPDGKDLQLDICIDDSLKEVELNTDEMRLKQIFSILISNAIKFTDKGAIEIGCKRHEHSKVRFYVKDTGIGINPHDHEIIFERFRKIEGRSNNLYRGAGLGLSIAKHLVTEMGGVMWLESKPNEGSIFYFTQEASSHSNSI